MYGLKLPECWLQWKNELIVLFIYYDSRHTVVPYDVTCLVVYEELTSARFYCRSSRSALYETTLIASSREKRVDRKRGENTQVFQKLARLNQLERSKSYYIYIFIRIICTYDKKRSKKTKEKERHTACCRCLCCICWFLCFSRCFSILNLADFCNAPMV